MGAALGSGGDGGGSRRGRRRRHSAAPMSEINVTPFVDVMLVLLIIFMVAAPLLQIGVPIELPQSEGDPLPSPTREPVAITITSGGEFYLNEDRVLPQDIPGRLAALDTSPEDVVYIRGDSVAQYGEFMMVMGVLNSAGFNKFGLVGLPPDAQ